MTAPRSLLLRGMTIAAQSEELAIAALPLTYPVYGTDAGARTAGGGLAAGRPDRGQPANASGCASASALNPVLILSAGGSRLLGEPTTVLIIAKPPAKHDQRRSARADAGWSLTPCCNDSPAPLLRFAIDRPRRSRPADQFIAPSHSTSNRPAKRSTASARSHSSTTSRRPPMTMIATARRFSWPSRWPTSTTAPRCASTPTSPPRPTARASRKLLGSGDATIPYQSFMLRQPPLTYVSADTPSGSASTLKVYVNDVLWQEAPFFYGRGANEHIYVARRDDDGTHHDSIRRRHHRRAPAHRTEQRARRISQGQRAAAGWSSRADQPAAVASPGIERSRQPGSRRGRRGPESRDDARKNAPLTVLTLDRAVSLQDYEDFARTFAGVAKAQAVWVWDGRKRSVFLTVAGPDGADLDEDGAVDRQAQRRRCSDLRRSLRRLYDQELSQGAVSNPRHGDDSIPIMSSTR